MKARQSPVQSWFLDQSLVLGYWSGEGKRSYHHTAPVNSLDFTKDGERLLSSGDDNRICLYSTAQGTLERIAQCNAHGATLARFTHDPLSVVVASPTDHAVRYMSLHDNRYLRYFKGHRAEVVGLCVSPKDDFLLSSSADGTCRLWDVRSGM